MRKYFILCSVALFLSCATTNKKPLNKQVTINDEIILLGTADRNGLKQQPFEDWFTSNYSSYTTNVETVDALKPAMKDIRLKVFMGTWCSDSQYSIPALYKILDQLEFDFNNLELITVDRNKTTPEKHERNLDLQFVPTIILYKDGKEMHRIVEIAMESLEADMLKIANGQTYKHAYED